MHTSTFCHKHVDNVSCMFNKTTVTELQLKRLAKEGFTLRLSHFGRQGGTFQIQPESLSLIGREIDVELSGTASCKTLLA